VVESVEFSVVRKRSKSAIFCHKTAFLAPEDSPCVVGAPLNEANVLAAYQCGIFPWSCEDGLLQWWSPDPRAVFVPEMVNFHKSVKPFTRRYEVKFDEDFLPLITLCRDVRAGRTWIDDDVVRVFGALFEKGVAHCVCVYEGGRLVGGLYGLIFGKVFCGESMVSVATNASKVAFYALSEALRRFDFLIDAQVMNSHLAFLGAVDIPRSEFLALNAKKQKQKSGFAKFKQTWRGFGL